MRCGLPCVLVSRFTNPLRARVDRYVRARVGEGVRSALPPSPSSAQPLHGTYVGNNRVLVRAVWGGRLLVPGDDLSHLPELVSNGIYDVPLTTFIQREIKPGDTVVDVGANIGIFTVLAGYQVWESGRVIAYEANPHNVEVLRDNVSLNWLSDRIQIVPKAAGREPGRLPFLAPRRFGGSGSLQPVEHLLVTEDRRDTVDRLEVDVEALDIQLENLNRIDLIKIDVEGGEEQVFAGMERLLGSGAVRRVSFELARDWLGADWAPFAERLRGLAAGGWAFATIPNSGIPEPASLDALLERERVSQVLLTRATP
jgi:FkbM family methyltransferase